LITFAGDKPFGLGNIVQWRSEMNKTVEIDEEVWSCVIPSVTLTKCTGLFVVTGIKVTVKRSAGQLEGNIRKKGALVREA
jgi:hypothetical protein